MELEIGKTYITRDGKHTATVLHILDKASAGATFNVMTLRTNLETSKQHYGAFDSNGNYIANGTGEHQLDLVKEYVPKEKVWLLKFAKHSEVTWIVARSQEHRDGLFQTYDALNWNLVKEQTMDI